MAFVLRRVTAMWQASFVYLARRVLGLGGVGLLHTFFSFGASDVLPGVPQVLNSGRSLS